MPINRKRSANPPLRVGADQGNAVFFQFHGKSSWSFLLGQRGGADLAVLAAVVFPLYPGLRRPVQCPQSKPFLSLQHGQQAPFDLAPEALLLPILVLMWSAT